MGVSRSSSPYARRPASELLQLCRDRGITGVDEKTPWQALNARLKAYDLEREETAVYLALAESFGLTPGPTPTRQGLLALLEPAMLAKLTQDDYFVPGRKGKPFTFRNKQWVLMGTSRMVQGRLECEMKVIGAATGRLLSESRWLRVFILYRALNEAQSLTDSAWGKRWSAI